MYAFDYLRPASLADAVKALGSSEENRVLAGGQTLIPTMKQRLLMPATLIDLAGVAELKGISRDANSVTIGAHRPHPRPTWPRRRRARRHPGAGGAGRRHGRAVHVRHAGTIGGSVANNDPAADYPHHAGPRRNRDQHQRAKSRPTSSLPGCSAPRCNRAS